MTTTLPQRTTDRPAPRAGTRIADFYFQPLSTHEWRIVDSRHVADSVEALVGFVARHDGAYYATRLKHPLESVPFASLDAVAAFVEKTATNGSSAS